MNKSRIEAERKPREADNFRRNAHSYASQKVPNRKWRFEMRKHNKEMKKSRIEAEWKPSEAESFREKFAFACVSENVCRE
jgi:hypothetical protein